MRYAALELTIPFSTAAGKAAIENPLAAKSTSPGAENGAVMLSTAIREQMGLKLEAGKGPVPVVTIQSVQRPEAN